MKKRKEERSRLCQLREELKVRQADVSEQVDIPYSTYSRYEKNPKGMPAEALQKIAAYFDIPMEHILQEPKSKNKIQSELLHKIEKMDIKSCKVVSDIIKTLESNDLISK